ncbi:MAG: adenylyl-sulfate reductase [Hydrogenophilales bacterium 17-61-9]|nr:MAG: adenylyl-sulfate reductase [Hydrogenophilales bacterium 17-61-9]
MIASNPFAELAAVISPTAMQAYVVLMFLLVVVGTILDMLHKKSAQYFFENARQARKNATRTLSPGEKSALALKTVANEVLTSGEFANSKRRISHLFTMYGFIIFVVATAILIFAYPTREDPAPTILPLLWHLGAAMLCLGGYWFWFSIRVDVASEGVKWYQLNGRGDLFIVGLLGMATFALLWSLTLGAGALNTLFFALFVAFSTLLFGSVYWSKFAHMFFKPAAAFQKRVIKADGSRENMPAIYDVSDPDVQARFPDIPTYMGDKPPNMGLGIKREAPSHF